MTQPEDRERISRIWQEKWLAEDVGFSLGLLAKALHLHELKSHGETAVKPVILIDVGIMTGIVARIPNK